MAVSVVATDAGALRARMAKWQPTRCDSMTVMMPAAHFHRERAFCANDKRR